MQKQYNLGCLAVGLTIAVLFLAIISGCSTTTAVTETPAPVKFECERPVGVAPGDGETVFFYVVVEAGDWYAYQRDARFHQVEDQNIATQMALHVPQMDEGTYAIDVGIEEGVLLWWITPLEDVQVKKMPAC